MRSIQRLETAGLSDIQRGGRGLKFSVVLQKTNSIETRHWVNPIMRKYRASENPGFGCLCLVNAFVWIVPFIESSSPSKNLDFCPCAVGLHQSSRLADLVQFAVSALRGPARASRYPLARSPKPSRLTRGRAIQGRKALGLFVARTRSSFSPIPICRPSFFP